MPSHANTCTEIARDAAAREGRYSLQQCWDVEVSCRQDITYRKGDMADTDVKIQCTKRKDDIVGVHIQETDLRLLDKNGFLFHGRN